MIIWIAQRSVFQYTVRMKDKIVKKSSWAAIFVAYCNGAPVDELAQIFDVGIDQVTDRIHREKWAAQRTDIENIRKEDHPPSNAPLK